MESLQQPEIWNPYNSLEFDAAWTETTQLHFISFLTFTA